jgi:soluble lytic murein transglycosylase
VDYYEGSGVGLDDKRSEHAVYNTPMGAAEVTALLKEYRGSLPVTVAGLAGSKWTSTAIHAIPRSTAVDWVERIPFAETRNYVQRVMENRQVYRARFRASDISLRCGER